MLSKEPGHLRCQREQVIPFETKQVAVELIGEGVAAGARQSRACGLLGISCRTLRRWQAGVDGFAVQRLMFSLISVLIGYASLIIT